MPLKRTVTIEPAYASRGPKKQRVMPRKKPGMYRSLNYNPAISRITRSGYRDFQQNHASQNLYGIAWNSTGFAVTQNNNTYAATSWAGGTDISSTFDAYRIIAVQLKFNFNQNNSNENSVAETLPYMYVAKDYDDINSSAGTATNLLQKPDCAQVVLGRQSSSKYDYATTVVPKVAPLAFSTTVASGYMEPKAYQWISTSSGLSGTFTDPWHYGIQFFIDCSQMTGTPGVAIGNVRVFMKVFFELKHPL